MFCSTAILVDLNVMMQQETVYDPDNINIYQQLRLNNVAKTNAERHDIDKNGNLQKDNIIMADSFEHETDKADEVGNVVEHDAESENNHIGNDMATERYWDLASIWPMSNSSLQDDTETASDGVDDNGGEARNGDMPLSLNPDKPTAVIMFFEGSFNPIHTRHMKALVLAKTWLEQNTSYTVVAGILAPACDKHVANKCKSTGHRYIKVYHRAMMCCIASSDYEWICTRTDPTHSIDQVLKRSGKTSISGKIPIAYVCGADRALKEAERIKRNWKKLIYICIGREGNLSRIKKTFGVDGGQVKNTKFYVVPEELDNVSSTSIRNSLQKEGDSEKDRRGIIQHFVNKQWLYPDVGQFLNDFHSYMYN